MPARTRPAAAMNRPTRRSPIKPGMTKGAAESRSPFPVSATRPGGVISQPARRGGLNGAWHAYEDDHETADQPPCTGAWHIGRGAETRDQNRTRTERNVGGETADRDRDAVGPRRYHDRAAISFSGEAQRRKGAIA